MKHTPFSNVNDFLGAIFEPMGIKIGLYNKYKQQLDIYVLFYPFLLFDQNHSYGQATNKKAISKYDSSEYFDPFSLT